MPKIILPPVNSFEEYEKFKLSNDMLESAAKEIIAYHHLPDDSLSLFEGTNIVFAYGNRVIKIYPPVHQDHFQNEVLVMKHLKNKLSVKTPEIEYEGTISGWPYIVMNRLDGVLLEGLWEKLDETNKITIIHELGSLIREVHSLSTDGLEAIDCHWTQFISQQINQCVAQHHATKLPEALLSQIPNYLATVKAFLPVIKKPVLLTGEYTPMNFLVTQKLGIWHIDGLIDFGDCMLGLSEYDLLGPGVFLIQGDKKLLKEFLLAYGYTSGNITPLLSRQLTALMLLHRYSNLGVQIRISNWKNKVSSLSDLEKLVWGF
ncbi:MAG: phosphotransferase [Gammaproteobacteria bacterium RIFCSPHIGHO2_12_FULL_37_14]|nr:MAG: phosphotransferase [Gammaproteobacteria bacterium RIFCSPHIGHO2_12_FULL_37_14]